MKKRCAEQPSPLFTTKGVRQRHRPWPLDGARVRRTKRGTTDPVQPKRQGYYRRTLAATCQDFSATSCGRTGYASKITSPGLTILVALVMADTAGMLEEPFGHSVIEAYSGKEEALEILRREDFVDLVITDQAMPKMTGTELAKVIRSEWPDIPVLLATGYAELAPRDEIGLPRLAKPTFLQRRTRNCTTTIKSASPKA